MRASVRNVIRSSLTLARSSSSNSGNSAADMSNSASALKDVVCVQDPESWDKVWQQGITPWDCGGASPPLKHLISTSSLTPHVVGASKALVPGCGSGYDCILLADAGFKTTGLDISKTAIERAEELKKTVVGNIGFVVAKKEPSLLKERATFVCDDFFLFAPEKKFNLIFDYTFFCAMPPNLRQDWANKMKELLDENGELVTLMFPVDKALPPNEGPPYPVTPDMYKTVLVQAGLTLVSLKPCDTSIKARMGREWIGRWIHAL